MESYQLRSDQVYMDKNDKLCIADPRPPELTALSRDWYLVYASGEEVEVQPFTLLSRGLRKLKDADFEKLLGSLENLKDMEIEWLKTRRPMSPCAGLI